MFVCTRTGMNGWGKHLKSDLILNVSVKFTVFTIWQKGPVSKIGKLLLITFQSCCWSTSCSLNTFALGNRGLSHIKMSKLYMFSNTTDAWPRKPDSDWWKYEFQNCFQVWFAVLNKKKEKVSEKKLAYFWFTGPNDLPFCYIKSVQVNTFLQVDAKHHSSARETYFQRLSHK